MLGAAVTVILAAVVAVNCGQLPASITPCSSAKADFDKCLLREAQKFVPIFCAGIPELDVPSADPMRIDKLSMDNAGLKLTIRNASLTGSTSTKFQDFNIDLVKKRGRIEHTSDIKLSGKYKLDGRILIIPVRGQGDFLMDIRRLHSKVKFNFDIVKGANGKRYVKLGSHNLNYEVLGKTHFDFKNLFNGNKILADTTLTFVNENWKIIMNDIAPPAIGKVTSIQMEYIARFLDNVPLDELIAP